MRNKYTNNLFIPLLLFLFISLLGISVGFSSMTTSLTINGQAAFTPVDMLRITAFEPFELYKSNEINRTHTYNSISTQLSLEDNTSYGVYEVTVDNLGEIAKTLDNVTRDIFSNTEMNYEIIGLSNGTIINPKNSITFKIKFKYKSNIETPTDLNLNTHLVFNFQNYVDAETSYTIVFNANGGSGTMNPMSLSYDEYRRLSINTFTKEGYTFKGWSTTEDGTGTYYKDGESVVNLANAHETFNLYAIWRPDYEDIYYEGTCAFGGKNASLQGNCATDDDGGFILTDIKPFSEDNYQRSFELSFTITELSDARINANKKDTFFSIIYEAQDNIKGTYPGAVMRIDSKKILLQGGAGYSDRTKIYLTKNDVLNKEFRLIRYNNGETNILYYMLGDQGPFVLKDVTNLYATFDTPLTFGANIQINNTTPDRYAEVSIDNIKFEYLDHARSLDEIVHKNEVIEETEDFNTVFQATGPCIFNGQAGNITGENCTKYHNSKYIDTGINLFSYENYEKDFEVSFTINEYDQSAQEVDQTTILNNFLERVGALGYGTVLRNSRSGLEFIARDGHGNDSRVYLPNNNPQRITIIRSDNKICYKVNDGNYKLMVDVSGFNEPFDVPLTFGASINSSGDPFRYIKGSLSDIQIKLGDMDQIITCE